MTNPHALMAAQNNADWYAMMWDVRRLRYTRDDFGFRAIDPPPPYHGWATVIPDAPIETLITPLLDMPGFAVKDGSGAHDLTKLGLVRMFKATWLFHSPEASANTDDWEQITTATSLIDWESAWRKSSPSDQRQFPDPILKRPDVRIWGRRNGMAFDAGVIANLSSDCVGLSNSFGANARPAATALCAAFGQGKPVVGYETDDDLADAVAQGWMTTGPLVVWVKPTD